LNLLVLAAVAAGADAPSADVLTGLVPPLTEATAGLKTLRVAGSISKPAPSHFTFETRSAEDAALYWWSESGVPLLVAQGGRAMFYDLFAHKVIIVADVQPGFTLKHAGERLTFNCTCMGGKQRRWKLDLDLRSIVNHAAPPLMVRAAAPGVFDVTGQTAKGSEVLARISPDTATPLRLLRIAIPGEPRPALLVSQLMVNEPLTPGAALPTADAFRSAGLSVLEVAVAFDDEIIGNSQMAALMERAETAWALLFALHEPTLRPQVEQNLRQRLDWDALAEREKQLRPIFRTLFQSREQTN
jgi:hypothetical protein